MRSWLLAIWLTLCFFPTLDIPVGDGNLPVRLDDLLVFGVFLWILISRRKAVGKIDSIEWILIVTAAAILIVTVKGSPVPGLHVGIKEYLDVLRPLKFLCVYIIARRLPSSDFDQLLKLIPGITVLLVLFALAQYLTPSNSDGLIAHLSLAFGRMDEELFRHYIGYRSFATFNTPTDLGYYMTLTMLGSICIVKMPLRLLVGFLAVLGLALAGTRTFMFALPPLLTGYFLFSRGTVAQRLKRVVATGLALVALLGIYPYAFPTSASEASSTLQSLAMGSFEDDESVSGRLQNLALASFTLNNAPLTGVVSRDMFPNAVDSEYLMTFHRYGLLGLLLTFTLFGVAATRVWRRRELAVNFADFCLLILAVSFLYGITQGALINTRVGDFPFIILGAFSAETQKPPVLI